MLQPTARNDAKIVLVSATLRDDPGHFAVRYVQGWIGSPNPLSNFDLATRDVRTLPPSQWIGDLLLRQYDGLLFLRGADIVGHIFFQRDGADLYAFSLWCACAELGPREIVHSYLTHAWSLFGIERAHVGANAYRSRTNAKPDAPRES